jgi:hypothetical protein
MWFFMTSVLELNCHTMYALHVCLSVFILMSLQVARIDKEMLGSF